MTLEEFKEKYGEFLVEGSADKTLEDMVKEADDKLYYGKENGRNRIIVEEIKEDEEEEEEIPKKKSNKKKK